ncbi:MAG: hypothetical protein ACK4FF_14430, partial [Limnobacter sp.]
SGSVKDKEISALKAKLAKAETDAAAKQKELEAEITRLNGEVDSLKATVQTKNNEITALKAQLSKAELDAAAKQKALEEQIGTLQTQVSSLESTVTGKDDEITSLKTQLAELQAKFDQAVKDAAEQQKTLSDKIAALEASGTAKDNEIASLKAQSIAAIAAAEATQSALKAELDLFKVKLLEHFKLTHTVDHPDLLVESGGNLAELKGDLGHDTLKLAFAEDQAVTIQKSQSWSKVSSVEALAIGPVSADVSIELSKSAFTAGIREVDLSGDSLSNGVNKVDASLADSTQSLVLKGSAGSDELIGGAGNDKLIGGEGADLLIGGPGIDFYDLTEEVQVQDEIRDSGSALDIDLTGVITGFDIVVGSKQGVDVVTLLTTKTVSGVNGDYDAATHSFKANESGASRLLFGADEAMMAPKVGDLGLLVVNYQNEEPVHS